MTPATYTSDFGNPPLLDGRGKENIGKQTEETQPEEKEENMEGRGGGAAVAAAKGVAEVAAAKVGALATAEAGSG